MENIPNRIIHPSLQFYSMIQSNPVAEATLKLRPLTMFAPTNRAFQSFGNNKTNVLYHICKSEITYCVFHVLCSSFSL